MPVLAALPMYDLRELRAATDDWWRGLAHAFERHGVSGVPSRLERRRGALRIWQHPGLLFSQICGYPLTHDCAGLLQPLATPCYRAEGCEGADYASMIVVRKDDPATGLGALRGRRAAINAPGSHSGWNVLRAMVAPLATEGRFFAGLVVSGSHARSLAMVASGAADVAAIDAVTHAMLACHRPALVAGTRILARSPRAPGLPYVTRAKASVDLVERLREGLFEALADPALAACRDRLLIAGAKALPLEAYEPIRRLARAGSGLRDPMLRRAP